MVQAVVIFYACLKFRELRIKLVVKWVMKYVNGAQDMKE
jgi:hypothetical protein